MNKEQKIKRIQRRAHRKMLSLMLGSNRAADQTMRAATDKRIERDLCLCGDDEKHYLTREEAIADNSPRLVCSECGKNKLRVKIILGEQPSELRRFVLKDLLR